MSEERSRAARDAIQRADARDTEIRAADTAGRVIQGLGPVAASASVPAAQNARDRANAQVGRPPSRGLSAAETKRLGLKRGLSRP
ncbi:hypothetical protein LO772_00615 [Yinghuangia sp. ASG 101]|uniref:hypothetical protein n=1 Tax=Yinghuangia sp. ASG 101 TaxID=2896848 RepID=UPI001E2E7DFD|nr:hypothetical protein [Yinghuangia sp. ASG 101]UGQ12146.1 hypothetical protein LO772_00615 [Yinghuangia sp. ASG 101]